MGLHAPKKWRQKKNFCCSNSDHLIGYVLDGWNLDTWKTSKMWPAKRPRGTPYHPILANPNPNSCTCYLTLTSFTWHSPSFTLHLTLSFFHLLLDTHRLLLVTWHSLPFCTDTWHSPSFTWYTWHSPFFLVVTWHSPSSTCHLTLTVFLPLTLDTHLLLLDILDTHLLFW